MNKEKWSLKQFVEVLNKEVPIKEKGDSRRAGEWSERLVRHYISSKKIPPAIRIGKNAFYNDEHLNAFKALNQLIDSGVSTKYLDVQSVSMMSSLNEISNSKELEQKKKNTLNLLNNQTSFDSLFSGVSASVNNSPLNSNNLMERSLSGYMLSKTVIEHKSFEEKIVKKITVDEEVELIVNQNLSETELIHKLEEFIKNKKGE